VTAGTGPAAESNRRGERNVPLALRNVLANKPRFVRSEGGIAFAVLLMLIQIGFYNAFLDSALAIPRRLDGEVFLISTAKYRVGRKAVFPRRNLYAARAVEGVASARPLYGEWLKGLWKNPRDRRIYTVQVLAFDPDQPVFADPEITGRLDALRQPDTVVVDRFARRFLGMEDASGETELIHRKVRIVGSFQLGPDFAVDGTVLLSDRNFMKLLPARSGTEPGLPDIEIGVLKVQPGHSARQVQQRLRRALPPDVAVLTKAELIDIERKFQSEVSPVGPIFTVGTLIGFVVGMLISYKVLYNDLSDQLPQYATLKAMGYSSRYLATVVLQQSVLYGIAGFVPAWLIALVVYGLISHAALLPMNMSLGITLLGLGLTLAMCVLSGLVAVRRVITADPAELY
jgi:putative ABC transport system permease protein